MKRYAMCYASFCAEDNYLYTDCHVFDTLEEAEQSLIRHREGIIEDCENAHGKGNWYSEQDSLRSFDLKSDDGRDFWTLRVIQV